MDSESNLKVFEYLYVCESSQAIIVIFLQIEFLFKEEFTWWVWFYKF